MSENINNFRNIALTSAGLDLLSKVQAGTQLVLTRVVIGSGFITDDESAEELTNLVSLIPSHSSQESGTSATVDITYNRAEGDGKTALRVKVQNGDTDFYLREIGIMAQDPDNGEILYAYTCCTGDTNGMPAYNGQNRIEDNFTLITKIGNADNLTVNITLPAEVKQEDFDKLKSEMESKTHIAVAYRNEAINKQPNTVCFIIDEDKPVDPEELENVNTVSYSNVLFSEKEPETASEENWFETTDGGESIAEESTTKVVMQNGLLKVLREDDNETTFINK